MNPQEVTVGGRAAIVAGSAATRSLDLDELVAVAIAAFRQHPHICNVMTHVSRERWDDVRDALRVIFDPRAFQNELTPLAENIIYLLCAESGVTGRILKPYFRGLLARILPPEIAARLTSHVGCLFLELEARRSRSTERRSSRSLTGVHPVLREREDTPVQPLDCRDLFISMGPRPQRYQFERGTAAVRGRQHFEWDIATLEQNPFTLHHILLQRSSFGTRLG